MRNQMYFRVNMGIRFIQGNVGMEHRVQMESLCFRLRDIIVRSAPTQTAPLWKPRLCKNSFLAWIEKIATGQDRGASFGVSETLLF